MSKLKTIELAPPTFTTPEVLRLVHGELTRYIAFPSEQAADAVALWTLHTHVMPAWPATPRLAVNGPKGCGKTRVLEVLSHLAPRAVIAVNLTPVVLWRMLGDMPTILFDETDTVFGKAGSATAHQELRAILNAGHTRGGVVYRAVGAESVRAFPVYGACGLAGIGSLPDTIADRSIIIRMEQRKPNQEVAPFRESDAAPRLHRVRQALESWARGAQDDLSRMRPDIPVSNRAADVWGPIITIGEHAGKEWLDRATQACLTLTATSGQQSMSSLLLDGIRRLEFDRIRTQDLLRLLWANGDGWNFTNLTAASLASYLAVYEIRPGTIRFPGGTAKGYYWAEFGKAFAENPPSQRHG